MSAAPVHDVAQLHRASSFIKFNGRDLRRVSGFVSKHRIRCPAGHVVNEPARILEDGAIFCDQRDGPGHTPCGAMIYILVIPGRGTRRRIWAADCTRQELEEMERLGLDADGVLAYFGAGFTR